MQDLSGLEALGSPRAAATARPPGAAAPGVPGEGVQEEQGPEDFEELVEDLEHYMKVLLVLLSLARWSWGGQLGLRVVRIRSPLAAAHENSHGRPSEAAARHICRRPPNRAPLQDEPLEHDEMHQRRKEEGSEEARTPAASEAPNVAGVRQVRHLMRQGCLRLQRRATDAAL